MNAKVGHLAEPSVAEGFKISTLVGLNLWDFVVETALLWLYSFILHDSCLWVIV